MSKDIDSLKNKNALPKTNRQVKLAITGPIIESSLFLYMKRVKIKLAPYAATAKKVLSEKNNRQ